MHFAFQTQRPDFHGERSADVRARVEVNKLRIIDFRLSRRSGNCRKQRVYSITSSARASRVDGMSMPFALAVLRFTTSSNLVGCSTGKSAGFAPLKILSTKTAVRRNKSRASAPYASSKPASANSLKLEAAGR